MGRAQDKDNERANGYDMFGYGVHLAYLGCYCAALIVILFAFAVQIPLPRCPALSAFIFRHLLVSGLGTNSILSLSLFSK